MMGFSHVLTTPKKLGVMLAILFTIMSLFVFSVPATAYAANENSNAAEQQHYMDMNVTKLFDGSSSGSSNSTILSAGINILRTIMTAIMLPVGILMCLWRVIYLAIFPMLMQTDPLYMLAKDQNNTTKQNARSFFMRRGGSIFDRLNKDAFMRTKSERMIEDARNMIRGELIDSMKGLIFVALFWSLVQLALWGVQVFVSLWHA